MTSLLWIVAALLVALAGVFYLRRLRGLKNSDRVTDEMITRIESVGRVEVEDPLDLGEVAEEERKFWEETWDEPEEY
jgi:hypothetical protein